MTFKWCIDGRLLIRIHDRHVFMPIDEVSKLIGFLTSKRPEEDPE